MNGFYGECLCLEIFGQSHAESVGMTLEGVPAGARVDLDALLRFMQRRAPGRSEYATARREADVPEFTSGYRAAPGARGLFGVGQVRQHTNGRRRVLRAHDGAAVHRGRDMLAAA